MPLYTYRREDGSTFEIRQSFSDPALSADPDTGQKVVRVIHTTGVIFKGSGFYVTDSKGASKSSVNGTKAKDSETKPSDSEPAKPAETKSKVETPAASSAAD